MAIKGIYNADGATTYTTTDVKLINSKFANNKIVWGDSNLKVTAQTVPAMSVKVSAGVCSINGAFLQNTASYTVSIASNTASYPRIDAIVAYISGTTYQIKVLQGTANTSPSAPSTTSSYYVKLAEVYVGVGVTAIQDSNITDSRATNSQTVISSLSEEISNLVSKVTELEQYKVTYANKAADRGYRLHEDGYCRCWNSGIQNIAGNALSITITLPYEFKNKASCSVTARFVGSNNMPINLIARMDSGNTVFLYYPAASIPQLYNGNGSWFICVEGY